MFHYLNGIYIILKTNVPNGILFQLIWFRVCSEETLKEDLNYSSCHSMKHGLRVRKQPGGIKHPLPFSEKQYQVSYPR